MKTKEDRVINICSPRFCLGCVFAAAALLTSLLVYNNFKAGVFFTVLFVAAGAFRIPKTAIPHHLLPALYGAWLIVTAIATLGFSQLCLNEVLPECGISATILGVVLIALLFLIFFAIILRIRISTLIVSAFLLVFTCVNYFVFLFRGSEIVPADILSITTAGNVAAEYTFQIPAPMFYALTLSVVYYFLSFALPPMRVAKKQRTRLLCSIAALACVIIVCAGGYAIKPLHWLQTGSVKNGYLLNFTIMLKDSFPQKPHNYDSRIVDQIAKGYGSSEGKETREPDIIVIMDESYADLSVLGNPINTDTEISPFIENLQENTLRGYTLSSVFGGGTPNSEYEFLTGNTLLFLPTGAIAYQQFINQSSYSVAYELKQRGYKTIAMHPYLANGWMRDRIWPMLGFEECFFLEDFPQKDMLRNWGTDQEMFETIVSVHEDCKKSSDAPVFIFAVTIQNHGGYDYSENDFETTVHIKDYSQTYPDVEQYLTCIHETDKAVQWIIDYYDQNDRDVAILFYGDHFPKLDEAFYEEVHGAPFETMDEQMLQYEVPFFIWTNYESEADEVELVSMNYLSDLLFEHAGMENSPYQAYLEDVRQTIPACNALGYYSAESGEFMELKEARGQEKDKLLEYNWMEWNCIFDKDNKNITFFATD